MPKYKMSLVCNRRVKQRKKRAGEEREQRGRRIKSSETHIGSHDVAGTSAREKRCRRTAVGDRVGKTAAVVHYTRAGASRKRLGLRKKTAPQKRAQSDLRHV